MPVRRSELGAGLVVGVLAAAGVVVPPEPLAFLVLRAGIVASAVVIALVATLVSVRRRADAVARCVRDAREKASRHEFQQAQALGRIERLAEQTRGQAVIAVEMAAAQYRTRSAGLGRVLMVTSNGAGLGHLTRCLALAHVLPDAIAVDILTLSTAAAEIRDERVTVHYFPSRETAALSGSTWERAFTRELVDRFVADRPDVIMFDGTYVYRPVHDVARSFGIPLVWILRGCWKEGRQTAQTRDPADVADALLLPDDYACASDFPVVEPNLPVYLAPPLTLTKPGDLLERAEALDALGLDTQERYVLIQLGAGNIDDIGESLQAAAAAVLSLGDAWRPVISDSPLSRSLVELPGGVARIRAYPLARYFNAFEFAVLAAGYNSVQEALSLGLPAIFVPNTAAMTDDQQRRAVSAADRGLALTAATPKEIRDAVVTLAAPDMRATLRAALASVVVEPPRGFPEWLASRVTAAR